ncbi:MAG: DUF1837 domain-containing protein [Gemmatimonadaceae bacterium]
MPKRPPFLKIIVHDDALEPGLTALCAGFELGAWRAKAFADYLMRSLPDFCLTFSEYSSLDHENAVELIAQAAQRVYKTKKFRKRGEFGELLLHVVLKHVYETVPAISKIYYKDSANDTVKGFDAVHVVVSDEALELWLGEVKFYSKIDVAIRDVTNELVKHTDAEYLRSEFLAIRGKIDPSWPHADRLKLLIDENVSLDEVFDCVCIPVLLTYDGEVTQRHSALSDNYKSELQAEIAKIYQRFASGSLPPAIKIHLFLVPLATKTLFLQALDEKLRTWQKI